MTVLVVDDDKSVRKALSRLLRSHGYRVFAFESAEELLQSKLLADQVCLILDIRLPGLSGFELYDILRSTGITCPVVFITACDESQLERSLEKVGPAGYLRKPFGEKSLLDAIQFACSANER